MDWKWLIGTAIAVGLATAGGIWALVQIVAKLAAEAATIKTQLSMVLPIAQEMPQVKQVVAVHEERLDKHDEDIREMRSTPIGRKH